MLPLPRCNSVAAPATAPYLPFCHQPCKQPHISLPPSYRPRSLKHPLPSLRPFRPMASSAASPPPSDTDRRPFSVLFVCLGNICRSPAAEAVFREIVEKRGLEFSFKIDSAGTIGYHEGNPADSRMIAAAKRRGIEVTSMSRPIRPSDFKEFDLILAMDLQNREDILSAYERWGFKEPLPEDAHKKVKLMCSYCRRHRETEVPDPYYGGFRHTGRCMRVIT